MKILEFVYSWVIGVFIATAFFGVAIGAAVWLARQINLCG